MNNYDAEINRIVIMIGNDKAIIQPWRNKAKARLEEAQAFIHYGQNVTNQRFEPGKVSLNANGQCTCSMGVLDKNCPIHGGAN